MSWREVRSLPSRPDSGEVLTPNVMRSVGSSTSQPRQRTRVGRVGDGVADGHLGQARDGHDLARAGLGDLLALDAPRRGQRGHRAR